MWNFGQKELIGKNWKLLYIAGMENFSRTSKFIKGEINMYNNYYQPTQGPAAGYPTRPSIGLKGRPVSSIEEARATSIDFDGTVFYFPDLANNRIYTKQINMDGTASLLMYELKEIPNSSQPNFVTKEEFDNVIEELKKSLSTPQQSSSSKSKQEFKF